MSCVNERTVFSVCLCRWCFVPLHTHLQERRRRERIVPSPMTTFFAKDKRMKHPIRRIICLVLLCCAFVGFNCSGGPETKTPKELSLKASFEPSQPGANESVKISVTLQTVDKENVEGADVRMTGKMGEETLSEVTFKDESGGQYVAEGVTFPKPGKWELTFSVKSDVGEKTFTEQVDVACKGDGKEGSTCCGDDDCDSKSCKEGVCAAPTCQDGKQNGDEGGVDCGGSCDKCARGAVCQKDADCITNSCDTGSNKCVLGPGGLLGWKNKEGKSVFGWTTLEKGLFRPTDLSFHPEKKNELWVVAAGSDTLLVLFDGTDFASKRKTYRDLSQHFMEEVQAISFGSTKTMATCGDSRNTYAGLRPPNNFMGPVWWSADTAFMDRYTDISKGHLDMLPSTPQCMGIAGTGDSTYFAFNGYNSTLDWYDFKEPHVPGGDDHTDGVKRRYSEVSLKRVEGVPSNLVYDKDSKWLYIADTGNGRVIRVNVEAATSTQRLRSFPGDGILDEYKGVKIEEIVKPGGELKKPSGLALHKGVLYVGDYETGILYAYNLKGEKLNSLDTELGGGHVGGLTVGPDERIYFIDLKGRVLRINIPTE